jgi:hypothetical protein
MRARFCSLFRLTRIGRRMFWSTEASISCNNVSVVVTCEYVDSATSSTHLQLISEGGKLGEPGWYSLDTLGLAAPEDPGAGATSPGTALPGRPASVLCITKSRSKLPTTSMPMAPCVAQPAPCTLGTHATTDRGKPKVTTARSHELAVDDAIKGRHGGIAGWAVDRRATGTNEA